MICNGKDALKCVAEKDGRWNWALVGPNPESLPLVGGGGGSVEEMRECLAKQEAEQKAEKQFANFYGLLRLKFGSGRAARVKYVFVQASRFDEQEGGDDGAKPGLKRGNTMSAVKHGQAMAEKGAMQKAVQAFAHFAAKIEATSLDDLSLSSVIEICKKSSQADADLITAEAYGVAYEEFLEKHPEAALQKAPEMADPENLTTACVADIFEQELAPTTETTTAVQDDAPPVAEAAAAAAAAAAAPASAKAAEELPKYRRGEMVFVYSNVGKQWMDDGVVVATLTEGGEHDGLSLPKDAIKVQYNNRRQFKWVTPLQLKSYVKPSKRPSPPPTLLGELLKETHNLISQWHVRYFELSKGYLQWWMTADDAKSGVVPNGSLSLTGLELTVKDTKMYIRTATSKGMVYSFDATTAESISKWGEMMKQHEEYCSKIQAYFSQRAAEEEEGVLAGENFMGAVVERKKRASLVVAPP